MSEIETIRERAERATPGPWYFHVESFSPGESDPCSVQAVNNQVEGPMIRIAAASRSRADAEFIARARTDIPDLLDRLAASLVREEDLRAALERLVENWRASAIANGHLADWGGEAAAACFTSVADELESLIAPIYR